MTQSLAFIGWLAAAAFAFGCTAVSVSPPLASPTSRAAPARNGDILLTSGTLHRPRQAIGVVQLTQTGYRWFYEVEMVSDANPGSILVKVARYARMRGADGIQFLELIDLKPQSPGERTAKQIDGVMRVARAATRGRAASQLAAEGEETRWLVRGELVRFTTHEGRMP